MSDDRYWILIGRQLSGEITEAELKELAAMRVPDAEEDPALSLLSKNWPVSRPSIPEQEKARKLELLRGKLAGDAGESPEPVLPPMHARRGKTVAWITMVAAACIAGACYLFFTGAPEHELHEITAKPGIKSRITLPDGSLVWLNAGSKLAYDDGFGRDNRRIRLNGEAYFDVATQAETPFVITAAGVEVKVLGTAFNLKAYDGEPSVETALLKGSVQVAYPSGGKTETVLLKPMEKLLITRPGAKGKALSESVAIEALRFQKGKDGLIPEIAWKDNTLCCDREPFPSLAARLERWYNVDIRFADDAAAKLEFTATIKSEKLEDVLDALKAASGHRFDYTYDSMQRTVNINEVH
ncbi:FecR family protein [Chitinophaga lutea]|nr:FecR domain-containing protein [Chitinophaga lutea]